MHQLKTLHRLEAQIAKLRTEQPAQQLQSDRMHELATEISEQLENPTPQGDIPTLTIALAAIALYINATTPKPRQNPRSNRT